MKTLVNSVTHWDSFFATAIFGLSGRRLLSSTMPWISHTGNGYYYPVVPVMLLIFDARTAWYVTGNKTPMLYGLGAQTERVEGALNFEQAIAHIYAVEERFEQEGY